MRTNTVATFPAAGRAADVLFLDTGYATVARGPRYFCAQATAVNVTTGSLIDEYARTHASRNKGALLPTSSFYFSEDGSTEGVAKVTQVHTNMERFERFQVYPPAVAGETRMTMTGSLFGEYARTCVSTQRSKCLFPYESISFFQDGSTEGVANITHVQTGTLREFQVPSPLWQKKQGARQRT